MVREDKKLNEVIRVCKKQSDFVLIDKGFLENENLSWKAKGILAYLLSKPDNWKVIVRDIVNHSTDGKASVYSGLNQLKACGYYEKTPVRDDKGAFVRWDSTVYECPTESPENALSYPLTDFPEMDNPDMDNPDIENRERNNNYINNNYKTFNNNQSSQSVGVDGRDETEETAKKVEVYIELIKHSIAYNDFAIANPNDMGLIDEIIAVMVDVMLSKGKYIAISGEDKPRALIQHNIMRLTHYDIEYVIEQYKSYPNRIQKKKQFILTMLYNASMESNAHVTNLFESDKLNGRVV